MIELAEIQSHVPQSLLDQLCSYQKHHNLRDISQAIAAALAEFFSVNSILLNNTSTLEELPQITEQLETAISEVTKRLSALENDYFSIGRNSDQPWIQTSPSLPIATVSDCQSQSSVSHNLQDDVKPNEPLSHCANDYPKQAERVVNPLERQVAYNLLDAAVEDEPLTSTSPTPLSNLLRGVSGSTLVKRLNTNPTTLRKYLRENNRIAWASQRDPDGLGWVYEPLLRRYHPIEVRDGLFHSSNIEPATSERTGDTSLTATVEVEPQATTQELGEIPPETSLFNESQLGEHSAIQRPPNWQDGLTQAQLSRLTNISANTLQRWKYQSDCTTRIQKRTRGQFIYWYSGQYEQFYPLS